MTVNSEAPPVNALLPSISIANLCNQRAAVLDRLQQAHALLQEAGEIAARAKLGDVAKLFEPDRYSNHNKLRGFLEPGAVSKYMQVLDGDGWQYLLNESGLKSFMDKTARDMWWSQVSEGKIPELTPENIASTFQGLHADRGSMVERGIIALYRRLSWSYKTNTPVKFGKRIILRGVTYAGGYINPDAVNELVDLTRAFSIMDGKPEPDHRDPDGIELRMRNSKTNTAENDYLSIRWYNGTKTGHVTFTRSDLVDRLNEIIARHHPNALPAAR